MQSELLQTGCTVIHGGPSTGEWSKFNGLIQSQIRVELRKSPASIGTLRGIQLVEALEALLPHLVELGLA
jgi:hypothetical protein